MAEFILLDGGMGAEIVGRGFGHLKSIWSGFALIDHPEVVTEVHGEYLDAGADVIITSNYGVVPVMLAKEGLQDRLAELTQVSVNCAQKARQTSGRKDVRIAGSLPPLEMSYRPDMVQDQRIMVDSYRAIADAMTPGVDLFVTETLSTIREAQAAAEAVSGFDQSFWLSMSLDKAANGCLRSGKSLAELLEAVSDYKIDAFLFNCCSVEAISAALPIMRELTDKPIGAYANSFGRMPDKYVMEDNVIDSARTDLAPDQYLEHAENWRDMGATIIGGCCGIGPAHIKVMNNQLRPAV